MSNGPAKDDFDFYTVGTGDRDFVGYMSDVDPTETLPNVLVEGSKNVYKKTRGNISVRSGLKRYLALDASDNGVVSSYEWQTSFGETRIIRVLEDGQWQVLIDGVFVTIQTFDGSRFVFTDWWNNTSQQSILIMVNGDTNTVYAWSGGVGQTGTLDGDALVISPGVGYDAVALSNLTSTTSVAIGNNGLGYGGVTTGLVFITNPENDATLTLIMSDNTLPSGTVSLRFVNSLPGITHTTTGYIKIGVNKSDTLQNLLAFLANPTASSAQYDGITDTTTSDAIALQTYETTNALSTSDGETWASKGFTDGYPEYGSSFLTDGVTYSYDLVSANYLIGIDSAPVAGSTAYSSIVTSTLLNAPGVEDTFSPDFCATITNQVAYGSYTSSAIYFAYVDNYIQISQQSQSDLVSGDPDQIVLDELPRGIIVVNEAAYIPAGTNAWYICKPNTPLPIAQTVGSTTLGDRYVIVAVEKKVGAAKSAALAHEFLGSIADTILYLGQDHQLRMFGTFKDIFSTKFPSVSIAIKQELELTDFTGGQIRAVGDRVYLVAPVPGKVFIYEQRDDVDSGGSIVSERLWQPPMEWGISRITIIDDIEYGYSSVNPETYQLWDTDQWHDDSPNGPMPYICVMRMAYWQFKDRTKKGDLDKAYVEGYMPENTQLTMTLRSDYLGSTAIEDVIVSAQGNSPVLYTEEGVLIGQRITGQNLIGGATGITGLPKFRIIPQFTKQQCFEYQMELSSTEIDSRWEIICLGTNGSQVLNKPVEIIKG